MSKGIQSIEHGFLLLNALLEAGEPMPMGRLAASAKMTTSKARAYLISLIKTGLVMQVNDSGPYELGPSAVRLGMEALRRVDAMQTARKLMSELDQVTRLPLLLTMWDGDHATILAQNEAVDEFPMDFRVGRPLLALTRTAAGLIYLSFLPRSWTAKQVELELLENPKYDDTRHITSQFLEQQIATVQEEKMSIMNGIRISPRMVLDGYSAIGIPVVDPIQRSCFAVTMFFNRDSSEERRRELIAHVRTATSQMVIARPLDD
jgi:DNA-binding IclR family transcriptional regulator